MRLSDAEREEALAALSEHVRTGRLDIEEFGNRSARVSAAKTQAELAPFFADLPEPRPNVLNSQRVRPAPRRSAPARRFGARAVPIAAIIAVLLFLTVARGIWFVFLLPVAVALILGARSR
jgi:hypothetical protein